MLQILGTTSNQDSGLMEIGEPMIGNVTAIETTITNLVPDSLYEFKVMTKLWMCGQPHMFVLQNSKIVICLIITLCKSTQLLSKLQHITLLCAGES